MPVDHPQHPAADEFERQQIADCRVLRPAVELLEQVLAGMYSGVLRPEPSLQLFGQAATEVGVRRALEQTLRELARSGSDRAERVRLVDRANQVRPRTLW